MLSSRRRHRCCSFPQLLASSKDTLQLSNSLPLSPTLSSSLSISLCLSFSPLCAERACALLWQQLCNVTAELLISSHCCDSVAVHVCDRHLPLLSLSLSRLPVSVSFNDVNTLQGQLSTDCTIHNRFSLLHFQCCCF